MSQSDSSDSWNDLISELGISPQPESQPSRPAPPPSAPSASSRAASSAPKAKPANWEALAGDLGIPLETKPLVEAASGPPAEPTVTTEIVSMVRASGDAPPRDSSRGGSLGGESRGGGSRGRGGSDDRSDRRPPRGGRDGRGDSAPPREHSSGGAYDRLVDEGAAVSPDPTLPETDETRGESAPEQTTQRPARPDSQRSGRERREQPRGARERRSGQSDQGKAVRGRGDRGGAERGPTDRPARPERAAPRYGRYEDEVAEEPLPLRDERSLDTSRDTIDDSSVPRTEAESKSVSDASRELWGDESTTGKGAAGGGSPWDVFSLIDEKIGGPPVPRREYSAPEPSPPRVVDDLDADFSDIEDEDDAESDIPSPARDKTEATEESLQRKRRRRRGGRGGSKGARETSERGPGTREPRAGGKRPAVGGEAKVPASDAVAESAGDLPWGGDLAADPLEATASEIDGGKRRRRRRRGGKKSGDTASVGKKERTGDPDSKIDDRELDDDELDDVAAEGDRVKEPSHKRHSPRSDDRARAPRGADDPADDLLDADDDELDSQNIKQLHRDVTPWKEAIGILIAVNMEARARSPRAHGHERRGGRGGGRGGNHRDER